MKPCLECGQLGAGPRCRPHELEYQRARSAGRTWYHGDWQTLRRVLKGRPCEMGCGRVGTELDHVEPRSRVRGVRWLCADCHRKFGESYKKFTT